MRPCDLVSNINEALLDCVVPIRIRPCFYCRIQFTFFKCAPSVTAKETSVRQNCYKAVIEHIIDY
jgi:hypothetical protein